MAIVSSQMDEFKMRVENILELPTLPHVLIHLSRLVSDPKTDAKQVGAVLSSDPSLSAKVLRMANSAFYGMQSEISTISRATVVLGLNTVHSLALTSSVLEMFDMEEIGGIYFTGEEFWKHSIATACVSKIICEETGNCIPEEGWIAGLLHDVGKIVLNQYFFAEFNDIMVTVNERDLLFVNAEKERLGVTHCNVGKWVVEKWGLPPMFPEAIATHHNPQKAEIAPALSMTVHVADILCRVKKFGNGGDNKVPFLDKRIFAEMGLTAQKCRNVMERMCEEAPKAFSILDFVER